MLTVLNEEEFLDFQHGDTYICKEPWRYRTNKPRRNYAYPLSQVKEFCKCNGDDYERVDWDYEGFMLSIELTKVGWYDYNQLSDENHGFEDTFELSDGTRVVAFGFVEGI